MNDGKEENHDDGEIVNHLVDVFGFVGQILLEGSGVVGGGSLRRGVGRVAGGGGALGILRCG